MARPKKLGYVAGAWDAFQAVRGLTEVTALTMIQRVKESEDYKEMGYETWEEFCNEQLHCSDEKIRQRLKQLHEFGPQFLGICQRLRIKLRDIKLLESSLSDDQKSGLKKGILEIEGKKIPIDEDHTDDLKAVIDLLIERAALAKKSENITKRKLEGIDKEHKKEIQAMQKEIEALKAQLPDKEDPKWALAYMENIEKIFDQFDLALRRFAFDKRIFSDPVIPAKISGIHEQMVMRLREFSKDWNVFLYEEWGDTD
ncbi:hypothetical protein A45J_0379 [hot springs metagenome]|uniref:DUF3102 domain-containing protein n=1 Tax=hot springs metagenome TaxID=433727 RepID=A0A5J4L1J8_9ZZZZ